MDSNITKAVIKAATAAKADKNAEDYYKDGVLVCGKCHTNKEKKIQLARGRRFKEKEPLDIRIIAYYPIPQSTSKKRHKEMLEHRIRPTVKPDLDNVAKLIYDALNGVAWHDDNAIVDTQVRKFYSDNPRVDVTIRTAGQENI